MNQITKKLHDKHMMEFKPFAEILAAEGKSQNDIVRAYQAWIKAKSFNFYYDVKTKVGKMEAVLKNIDMPKEDSKIEYAFYVMLQENGIEFKFHYGIGPYEADFLIGKNLVVEIDGPQHNEAHDTPRDKYLLKMGYRILRIPVRVLVSCPEACIESIKESISKGLTVVKGK